MRAEHLYIHVPFCARRCVYCDFSIAVRSRIPVEEYLTALEREWTMRHARSAFELETLYFGGGTPSKLGGDGVRRVMDLVRRRAMLRASAEITLEANPEDVSAADVHAWRDAGVNRVSLGVQSFDDSVLGWMHRTHDSGMARRAVRLVQEGGIDNVSIDLIFAAPTSAGRRWRGEIEAALELDLPHLSVYGMTVESHTPLGRWVARRDVTEAPEERFEEEFALAHDLLTRAGYDHYEVSNYARPGSQSRHNWAYWRRRPYGGLGPAAHEFDGTDRRWNVSAYAQWVERLTRGELPTAGSELLDSSQVVEEEVYLGLRTLTGVPSAEVDPDRAERLVSAGWAMAGGDASLRLTSTGWLRLDSIANDLTLLRSR